MTYVTYIAVTIGSCVICYLLTATYFFAKDTYNEVRELREELKKKEDKP